VPDRHLDRRLVISALGVGQILAWGTSFYFPAVFAEPIVKDTGWQLAWVVSGTSIGLLVAGLISPLVGRWINEHGGRPVLLASSLFYAVGLIGISLAPNMVAYLGAWVAVGFGMGCGLYDAVFASLGRMYGHEARGPITNLTLFGGFASTICWPLSAFLIEHTGWRVACLIYAALHLALSLPLQMMVVRRQRSRPAESGESRSDPVASPPSRRNDRAVFILLALVLANAAAIGSIVIVHLLIFMQARGASYAGAVMLGTLFGPAQVGARLLERLFGRHYHPIWTLIAACGLMAVGLISLAAHIPLLALIIVLYGAGYGITWIARGTLPLALFGPVSFPRLMGRLAFPALIAQALAPSAGAFLIERIGVDGTIWVLTIFALITVVLVTVLWLACGRHYSTVT